MGSGSAPSGVQKEIWLASQVGGDDASRAFQSGVAVAVEGHLDGDALAGALADLQARHDALRVRASADGTLRLDAPPIQLSRAVEADLEGAVAQQATRPFDLQSGPLARALHVPSEEGDRLTLVAHGLACDSNSLRVVLHDWAALYSARVSPGQPTLAPPPPPAPARSSERAEDVDWWLRELDPPPPALELPSDGPRPARLGYHTLTRTGEIGNGAAGALFDLARACEAEPVDVLLAALRCWLYRVTGKRDSIVGVFHEEPGSGGDASLSVGAFSHLVPVRDVLDPAMNFEAILAQTRVRRLASRDHAGLGYLRILELLRERRPAERGAWPSVTLTLDAPWPSLRFGALPARARSLRSSFSPFELALRASIEPERTELSLACAADVTSAESAERRLAGFSTLLGAAVRAPETRLRDLPARSTDECEARARWNQSTARAEELTPVPLAFEAQAKRSPEADALVFRGTAWSYARLDARANQIAHLLKDHGVEREVPVALCLPRGPELIAALLGVMKSGGCYVPLDPEHPRSRLQLVLENEGVPLVVCDSQTLPRLPEGTSPTLLLDAAEARLDDAPTTSPGVAIDPDQLAYVIYTSGSTGRPKGVEIEHRGVSNFLRAYTRELGCKAEDRVLAITTVSFDIAGLDLYMPLLQGACVHLAESAAALEPDRLGEQIRGEGITMMQAVPSTWRILLELAGELPQDLVAISGGEALPKELAERMHDVGLQVWNAYGPTETTIYSCLHRLLPEKPLVSIGTPIDNTTIHVLDPDGNEVPIGSVGELCIGGVGLARGYRRRIDLSAERFPRHPQLDGAPPDARIYHTGDLARFLSDGDGSLQCLGRSDFQVKIRGFRIELGEVESVLESCEGVGACVAHAFHPEDSSDPVLVAYLESDGRTPEALGLREALTDALPPYMVPSAFVVMDSLPLNVNGKVDRAALPAPQRATSSASPSAGAPRSDAELNLAAIFSGQLGLEEVGIHDDFFDLGGYSLLAVRTAAAINEAFGSELRAQALFQHPTVAALAEQLSDGGVQRLSPVITLREESGAPRLFCLMGASIYLPLARALGNGHALCSAVAPSEAELFEALVAGKELGLPSVRELAGEYCELVRGHQPNGPYLLSGLSFGGVVAFEVARQLEESGERVALVALFDSILPRGMWDSNWHWLQKRVLRALRDPAAAAALLFQRIGLRSEAESAPTGRAALPSHERELAELRDRVFAEVSEEWDAGTPHYSGRVVLFRALGARETEPFATRPDLGWGDLVTGELRIHDVQGDHDGLIEEPHVTHLSALLRREIAEAHRR